MSPADFADELLQIADGLGQRVAPLDRGKHALRIRAPHRVESSRDLFVEDGKEEAVQVPLLLLEARAATPLPPSTAPSGELANPPHTESPPPARVGGAQRTTGLVVAGVGLAGLAVGTIFGIRAASIGDLYSEPTCASPNGVKSCPNDRVEQQESARTSGTISTIALIGDGVLAVTGVVLYLTAPKAPVSAAASVSPDGASFLRVTATF